MELLTTIVLQTGLSTYSFPWHFGVAGYDMFQSMSVKDLLRIAAKNNLQRVQIGDNFPLHQCTAAQRASIKLLADDLGITLETGTRGLKKENITTYISIAQQLASPFLRIVIDDTDFHPDKEAVINTINSLLPQAIDANVILAIENHDRFGAATLAHIINATNPQWVGICLDTANSLGAGEAIGEILPLLAPYTVNLHLKDFAIKRLPHKMGFVIEGCALGDGVLEVHNIIHAIKQHNKCQSITLEVWSSPLNDAAATLQQERAWVQKSIGYLKTITA